MATRDVILKALQDWRMTAPLYIRSALGPDDLERLAEVAAEAGEGRRAWVVSVRGTHDDDKPEVHSVWSTAELANRMLSDLLRRPEIEWAVIDPPFQVDSPHYLPVGTPAEAEACAGRSGLGLGDVEHQHIEEL